MTSIALRREVLLVAALCACGQASGDARPQGESPLLSAEQAEKPPDLKKAASDPDVLQKAVLRRHRDTARHLGSHAFHGQHKMRVFEAGKEIEALDETATLELGATGDLHALYTNSKTYGREVYVVGGHLWVRPRYGKFHKRPPSNAEEPLRVGDEIYGALAGDLELVGFSLKVQDGGPAQVGGRAGHKVLLSLGPARKRPAEAAPTRKWRDAVTVQALEGEVVLDDQTGTVLLGKLSTKVSFQQEGHSLEMALESTHSIDQIAAPIAVKPPPDDQSVSTPLRSHEFEEREELLEGIAPPAPKAPVPGGER